jgi:hypothetical protein
VPPQAPCGVVVAGRRPAVLPRAAVRAGILFVAWLLGLGEHYLTVAGLAAVAFPVAAVVFVVGWSVKRHAYTLAERDSISSAEVYLRGAAPKVPEAEPGAAADGGA